MMCFKHQRELMWDDHLEDWVCLECLAEEFGDEEFN